MRQLESCSQTAKEENSTVIAVGGGAGRCASIFCPDASVLATLQGHTGWVRDVLFHEGQLYSHLAGSSNIYRKFCLGGWFVSVFDRFAHSLSNRLASKSEVDG